jgi:tRNA-binding protein
MVREKAWAITSWSIVAPRIVKAAGSGYAGSTPLCRLQRRGPTAPILLPPFEKAAMHLAHDPAAPPSSQINFDQFLMVDIRVGTIIAAEPYPEARKPSLKLTIDFGPAIGTRRSSAQIANLYQPAALIGRQVAGVVNFPPRQIGKFMSEVLTLGFPDEEGNVVLFAPDKRVPDGARLF